jgi:hypothetical protein
MKLTAQPAIDRLWAQLDHLRECLFNLWKTVDFAPESSDHYVVSAVADAVDNVQGLNQEAINAISPTQRPSFDLHAAWAALVTAGDCLVAADEQLGEAARTRVPQLEELARERGPKWTEWAQLVIAELGTAMEHVRGCIAGLLASWRELVEQEELAITTLRGSGGT